MRALVIWGLVLCGVAVARAEDAAAPDPLEQGRAWVHTEKHVEGVELLRRVVREGAADGVDASTWLRVARAHFYLDEDERAVEVVKRAIALTPKDANLHYWLAVFWTYVDVGQALAPCSEAVRLDPQLGKAWYELGQIHERREEIDEAMKAYLEAAELLPDDARAQYKAGNALKNAGRHDEALARYERATELASDFTNAWYNAALIHYLEGRFEKAYEAWKKAAVLAPDDLQIHAKVLQACYGLGRYDEGRTWRERVLAIHASWTAEEREKGQKDFCFDQFEVDDVRVYACERFLKEGGLYDHFVFKVIKEGKRIRQVNLESSDIGRELGFPYVLGENEGEVHRTYPYRWGDVPAYAELKALVVRIVRGELQAGVESERGKIRIRPGG